MKPVTIEALLRWAFAEELVKREYQGAGVGAGLLYGAGWQSISDMGELMAESGDRRRAQFYQQIWGDGPHADALAVETAVKGLADVAPVLHEDAAIFCSDLNREIMGEAENALAGYRVDIVGLVVAKAMTGTRPDWRIKSADMPRRKPICLASTGGHPSWFVREEIEGSFGATHLVERQVKIDPKTRRPPPGAYRKYRWEPGVLTAIDGRVDWLVWWSALELLGESLGGTLKAHRIVGSGLQMLPWEAGAEDIHDAPKVLPSLVLTPEVRPEKGARPLALGRKREAKAGPVRQVFHAA